MFGYRRTVIAQYERGLLFINRQLQAVLGPGVYRRFDPLQRSEIRVYDLSDPVCRDPQAEMLVKTASAVCTDALMLVETVEYEIGLVSYDGRFADVLQPRSSRVYWKGLRRVEVEMIDISNDYQVPVKLAAALTRPLGGAVPQSISNFVYTVEVADRYIGMLIVDGEFVKTLKPGFYAFWKFNRSICVEQVDSRVQPMEVAGQDILSRDKVSLRVNLAVLYQVTDAVTARQELKNPADWLYRELQFALRQSIGARNLDGLLGEKDALDGEIFQTVAGKAKRYGLKVTSVGIKDVILPGDMKEILNRVVEAEKAAQANVIKRREETAAMRSALNTAKLMADNPTLLRLKELEVLEKVTEKVDRLTVFGGLDGVLKDTVKINV